jgi:small subunit ribosomal protein S6
MPDYETIFITSPELSEDQTDEVASKMEILVREAGATLRVEKWGKRRLAYEVKHHNDGYFYLFEMDTQAEVINELERRLKLDDGVIRYLTVRTDLEKRRAEKLAAARGQVAAPAAPEAPAEEEPKAEEAGESNE